MRLKPSIDTLLVIEVNLVLVRLSLSSIYESHCNGQEI